MAGGDNKLSFSVENILKDHRKSSKESVHSHSGTISEVQPSSCSSRAHQIMRTKLTRRHYSTSSIETVGLGTGYHFSSRGSASSSLAMDSDNCIECQSVDTYTSSPSPLSSPRSVASVPQECLQGIIESNACSFSLSFRCVRATAVALLHWYSICYKKCNCQCI